MNTKTKTCNALMPKNINSKKNNSKSDINFLKELNGQVVVSVEQYKAHPDLFLGTPSNNLRLEDDREVILAQVIGNKAFPLERVADNLLSFILLIAGGVISTTDPNVKRQILMDTARAFKVYCAIMDLLDSGHMQDTLDKIRRYDESLYSILSDEEKVERLVAFSRSECEDPRSPKVQFGDESIEVEYLAHMVEFGYKPLLCGLDDEFESEEEYFDFSFTIIVSCVMVTQLRGMEKEEAIEYFLDELGYNSKESVEFFFNMLTIDKEAA